VVFEDGPLAHFLFLYFAGVDVAKVDTLRELIEPTVTALGYELWGLEYQGQGKYSVLRLFIDKEDGINVDDCASVSHHVSGVLDVEDPIDGEFTLEVSSPGMDRPLFTLQQFALYIGEVVNLKLRVPFEGRRKFKGKLVAVEGDDVVVQVDAHEYLLPISLIDKANVVPTF
jgi:ribosome maturation factor RimP